MNIDSIKRKLLVKYPLFGSVVANSNFVERQSVTTAGTDGKNIYYNPEFLSSITEEQQLFTLAHEICHIAFDHIFRSEGKDKQVWNIATDSVINAFLKQDGLSPVEGVVDIPEAINYDAEEMYEKLLESNENKQQNNSQEQNSDNNNSNQNQPGNNNEQDNNSKGQDGQGSSSSDENNEQNNSQNGEQQGNNNNSNSNGSDNSNQNQSGNNNEQDNNSKGQGGQGSSSSNGNNGQNNSQNGGQQGNNNNSNSNSNNSSNSNSSQNGTGQDTTKNPGHDDHSMWDKAIEEKHKREQSNSNNKKKKSDDKNNDKDNTQDKAKKKTKKDKNKQNNETTRLNEREIFKQNKIERKKQLEELRKSLVSKSHGQGTDTNDSIRDVTDIGTSQPLIDWRRLLKEAVKYDIDWSYQNAGIEDGVVTAYLEELPTPETEIVLDTSGSINETILRNFLRECKNILQTSKVKVGCFDTRFYGFTEIKNIHDIDNLPFYGGGGTDFEVAVNAFTRRVENKIIFTDGEAYMPSTPMDAIWIVFNNRYARLFGGTKINPKGGKVIYIDDYQLERLYHLNTTNKKKVRRK